MDTDTMVLNAIEDKHQMGACLLDIKAFINGMFDDEEIYSALESLLKSNVISNRRGRYYVEESP